MDEDEERATLRIRVLRRDSYRCMARHEPHTPICGAFTSQVGPDPDTGEIVALCPSHASR